VSTNKPENSQAEIIQIPDVSIKVKSPIASLLGVIETEIIKITLKDVLKFHGYCAGGVSFAFRAAQEAFKILWGDDVPVRQSMKVKTSYHCCQAGALAYITGARSDFGAERSIGDLELIPKEEEMIVFIQKQTGRQVILKPLFDPHDTFKPLFQSLKDEPELALEINPTLQSVVLQYINAPLETLFGIEY